MSEIKGIDVSSWDGDIDWKEVKRSGIDFAIIRVSAGSAIDEKFDYNIKEAIKNKLDVGVYLYTYAKTPQTAQDEAKLALEQVSPYSIKLPIFYDIEDKTQHNMTKAKRTDLIKAFCNEIESKDYRSGVYSSLNWFNNYFELSEIEKYTFWIADWGTDKLDFNGKHQFWQYSDSGKVKGISGEVDLDIWYKKEISDKDIKKHNHHIAKRLCKCSNL